MTDLLNSSSRVIHHATSENAPSPHATARIPFENKGAPGAPGFLLGPIRIRVDSFLTRAIAFDLSAICIFLKQFCVKKILKRSVENRKSPGRHRSQECTGKTGANCFWVLLENLIGMIRVSRGGTNQPEDALSVHGALFAFGPLTTRGIHGSH